MTPGQQSSIQSASRDSVRATLGGMRPFLRRSRWVGRNNRYATDTINRLRCDWAKNPTAAAALKNPRHLAQYIAASSVLHCSDGWTFLGKALFALLRGDPHTTRHLAYYAELRAAMALLATEGIGIFSKQHFVVDKTDSAAGVPGKNEPTHHFAWSCLDHWCSLPRFAQLFTEIVAPNGRPLTEWLPPVGGWESAVPHAQQWLRGWGLDLKVLFDDRNARNESSYRPDGIPSAWTTSADIALEFAVDTWRSIGPPGINYFEPIDSDLLRLSVEGIYKSTTDRAAIATSQRYVEFVERILAHQDLDERTFDLMKEFLLRERRPKDGALLRFSLTPASDPDAGHIAVVARATLLLRLATGSASQLTRAASVTGEAVRFWSDALAERRGLWEPSDDNSDAAAAWDLMESYLEDAEGFQTSTPEDQRTFFRIGQDLPEVICRLGEAERVPIWAIP